MPLVNIPFSPRYIQVLADHVHTDFHYQGELTYSAANFAAYLNLEGVKKDINRTHWMIDDGKNQISVEPKSTGTFAETFTFLKNMTAFAWQRRGIKALSDEEVQALHIIATTMHAPGVALKNSWSQGGVLKMSKAFLDMLWAPYGIIPPNYDQHVARTEFGLHVTCGNQCKELKTINNKDNKYVGNPVYTVEFYYDITEKDGEYKVGIDQNHYKIQIDEDILKNDVMPQVIKRLHDSEELSRRDYLEMVPFLCDKAFTKLFVKRLANEDAETIKLVRHAIDCCFDGRPQDVKRINAVCFNHMTFIGRNWKKILLGVVVGVAAVGLVAGLALSGVGIFAVGGIAAGFAGWMLGTAGGGAFLAAGASAIGGLIGGGLVAAVARVVEWVSNRKQAASASFTSDVKAKAKNSTSVVTEALVGHGVPTSSMTMTGSVIEPQIPVAGVSAIFGQKKPNAKHAPNRADEVADNDMMRTAFGAAPGCGNRK